MRKSIALTVAALALAACASQAEKMAEAGKEPMSRQEVLDLMADSTERGVLDNGVDWVVYWDPSGEVRGLSTWSGGGERDRGTWSVSEDGVVCRKWEKWQDAQEGCWKFYEEGDQIVSARVSGSTGDHVQKRSDFEEGNVENL